MATQRQILAQIDALEPSIARAFLAAVADMRDGARINALSAAIAAGDLERAAQLAGITPGAWANVTESTRRAYAVGGGFTAGDAPVALGFKFDMNNPRAERWLRDHSSGFVTRINDDQLDAIRETVNAGTAAGRNPRATALDIVGRVNRTTKRRTGGIVGLSEPQARYVTTARAELLSGDPDLMQNYLTRTRRDHRFDGVVRRAIADGRAVASADVDRLVGRYADRLLQTRGNAIARTEAINAFNEAADESLRQAIDQGHLNPESVVRIWDDVGDIRTRASHRSMDGQERGVNEPFQAPDGSLLMHPGDSSLGAPPEQVIQCRCTVRHDVDWIEQ